MFQPNPTLYVKNIDWKIKKDLLRRALYALFSRYGKVVELVTLRRDGLRGQAWVIYDDVQPATEALHALQGFTFFGKDLVIEYAREKSDRIAKRDGTFVPKQKRRKVEKPATSTTEQAEEEDEEGGDGDEASKQQALTNESRKAVEDDDTPPSKYLLAQDLPPECNEMVLAMLFRQYAGYKEVRMPRPGLAFIEFEDTPFATLAKKGMDGFKLTATDQLFLRYGKA